MLVFVACSDSDDDNGGGGDSGGTTTNIIPTEAKIGETTTKTITFTNPLSTEAEVYINISGFYGSIFDIDYNNSTCTTFNFNSGYNATGRLGKGESCQVTYTFAPSNF